MHKNQKYDWNNKEKFIEDLSESSSLSHFLVNNSLSASSGNFNTLKKWAHIYEIDLSTFNYKKLKPTKYVKRDRIIHDFDTVFCSNSLFDKGYLKKRIIKEKVIPYRCSCGLEGLWQNKPITLQLEHKNGNNFDNRVENLEFLCPNCHSQTSTYGSRNRHLKFFNKRLKILKGYKEINSENLDEIATKIKINSIGVHFWVLQYKDKIEQAGITVKLSKCTKPRKVNIVKDVIEEVRTNGFTEDVINGVANKYNTLPASIRKIIKRYDLDLYSKLNITQGVQKNNDSRILQEKRKDFLKSIDRDSPNVEDIINYFNMDKQRTLAWIGKYDKQLSTTLKDKTTTVKKVKL